MLFYWEGGRSPLGLRGLKFPQLNDEFIEEKSQPSWAAWIEIKRLFTATASRTRRSPLGLRGLKSFFRRFGRRRL